ncbi:glycine betaine/proline transport system substrate-binding protein [Halolactibacillus halophilus]|uniref:Glycine betaine/proline transport system substrate-binding protein n=1 Tax=Halolactibacillus halophilus TaxID=306540 RepID=A0A1I5PWU7_9BACI|nr:glycine betaine ABC transporter substrate-binding protein [Halolactibacillus halophilus]GEM02233.1 glycine/betaine ABC transporter substrate-binding protein [Halolactibacillus halophilus]SFP38389.1 glycine betaine/proline transport system substrate-binding protein [Halolactibacillus halophilus]
MKNMKKLLLSLGLVLVLILAACGDDSDNANSNDDAGESTPETISEEMEYTITGIEPGAGMSGVIDDMIENEENLQGWTHQTSSTGAMLTELDQAIQNEEPIVIAAWSPHYMFAKYDIKYLEDPNELFGGEENVLKLGRLGFEEDFPIAAEIVRNFYLELDVIEAALLDSQEQEIPVPEVVETWVVDNEDIINEFTDGVAEGNGGEIEMVVTSWDSELFPAYVLKHALESHGFTVNVTKVDPAIMFESIASGSADVTTAAWLPLTHGAFAESYEGEYIEMGPAYEKAKTGLAVPTYVELESISDLVPNE